ncbi:uncharacterized protein N0V89_008208 [Didymosphaeria variabile]|uniref:AA1-like domain-containing protein n=1 Tax=Didymosphaeria variabile TaxID=1932322 RepID=A0A9W8XH61_9PLEO|nr:uncharacterized protein N0V89_008208 [Didymosphaeria variabile]KAJ4349592.1 hypothetical protein N0V89_008208 [Didymosphaeria variabile]
MRFILLPVVALATTALANTNLTFTKRTGETFNFELGPVSGWFDVSSAELYIDIATVAVTTDSSEVAACYVSSNSLSQSKWVLSDPFGGSTEFGGADVKFVSCQEDWELPEWIGKDAVTID